MKILEAYKELKKEITSTSSIFIMGHRDLDLDALGAALGIYQYAKAHKIKAYIVIDDKREELGVKKVHEKIKNEYRIIKSKEIPEHKTAESLLIIVDTNKQKLLQNPQVLDWFPHRVIIDHHHCTKSSITEGLLIIDEESSSACEMVSELLEKESIEVKSILATVLLAGIMLDTNNYVLKTSAKTFKISYYLVTCGGKPEDVQIILKQDMKRYIERQKVITNVKIVNNVAITKGRYKELYRKEDLAKIADTLLQFNKVQASFMVGRIEKNLVGISARSMGKINVGKILEQFGGGGNHYEAAARIVDKTTEKIRQELEEIIKKIN